MKNWEGNLLLWHHVDNETIHDLVVAPDETIIRDYLWHNSSVEVEYWEF